MKGFIRPILLVGWLALFKMPVTYSQKIHEEMNQREREQVFLSPNVPDYEVVPIYWPRVQKRNAQNRSFLQLKAFGEDIKLWLTPAEGFLAGRNTPVYGAMSGPNGTIISEFPNIMYEYTTLYEELFEAATLAISNNHISRREISGVIGMKNLGIRSLPKRFVKKVEKYRRSLDGIPKSDYYDHHYHIVYKIASTHLMKLPRNSMSSKQRMKRFIPSVIYPEILVVIGYDLLRLLHRSIIGSVPYMLALWNNVDMLYRNLENPKYRLNIAGILVAQDPQAFEYMTKNKYSAKKLNMDNTLNDFGKWLFKQDQYIPVNSYDVAITMTSYKLHDETLDSNFDGFVAGVAHISSACEVITHEKNVKKTAIVYDNAGFIGIGTAAHELGHLLGAHHDSLDRSECRDDFDYIMNSISTPSNNSADWSKCSLSDFQSFLESNKSTCLFNIPNHVGDVIPVSTAAYLPGKIMNADEQCQLLGGTHAMINEKTCRNLICAWSGHRVLTTNVPAADGTSCGNGKLCLHQQSRDIQQRDVQLGQREFKETIAARVNERSI
ncbi:hypothetical protein PV327_005755 [Microctonus hyperodae]|uniref:Peptidase M12B domain-containing protein n=1 Tax=Microctonus hyperodae TaxID=165561 RepID=A0AA39G210_MICHY|nr:hypothetical protein PV327_005755 [Microctonus hyperodae]